MVPRNAHPDYVVDVDRGSSTAATKTAELLNVDVASLRGDARSGLRELDAMTEGMSALNRLQKDRERLFPRATTAELGDPRMQRLLPTAAAVRGPLSARQRNERCKDRMSTQRAMPATQLLAQVDLVSGTKRWKPLNDQLSDQLGDVQELPAADQQRIRRIDRSIQSYERRNDRGHVIYTNVTMPAYINHANREPFVRKNFAPGQRMTFDRYTVGTHQLHETSSHAPDDGRVMVFELQTRRGAYLGNSDKIDNTGHLLPRGMELEVVGVHEATYQAPDGTSGTRLVVQLRDVTPEPATAPTTDLTSVNGRSDS